MTLPCNKENMAKLVKALRSGKYEQGYGGLRSVADSVTETVKHCCLGVACDISGLGEWQPSDTEYFPYFAAGTKSRGYLPSAVSGWLGIDSEDIMLEWEGEMTSGIAMNDNGNTFGEIAQAIEETYLK